MNLSGFRKISEDKQSAVFKHSDGHKITVAKNALSGPMRKQVASLPLYQSDPEDEVGDSEASKEMDSSRDVTPSPDDENARPQQAPQTQMPNIVINNAPPAPVQQNPIASLPAYDPKAATYNMLTDPSVNPNVKNAIAERQGLPTENALGENNIANLLPQTGGRIPVQPPMQQSEDSANVGTSGTGGGASGAARNPMLGLNQMQTGIRDEANAQSNLSIMQSKVLRDQADQQQKDAEDYSKIKTGMDQEYSNFQNDLKNQHVDPNAYWNKMGTGQKIMTSIGLILGGLGGGANSPVFKMIDDDIDRDMKSQQQNIDNKNTLFRANLTNYQNQFQAAAMTRAQHLEMFNTQLQQAAADSADPIAQARAKQMGGQIQAQIDQALNQGAQQKFLMDRQRQNNDPGELLDAVRSSDPKQGEALAKRYAKGFGFSRIDIPDKGRDELSLNQEYEDLLNRSIKFQKSLPGNRAAVSPDQKAVANALQQEFDELGTRAQGINRLNGEEIKLAKQAYDPGSWSYANPIAGLTALKQANSHRKNLLLDKYDFPEQKQIKESAPKF